MPACACGVDDLKMQKLAHLSMRFANFIENYFLIDHLIQIKWLKRDILFEFQNYVPKPNSINRLVSRN